MTGSYDLDTVREKKWTPNLQQWPCLSQGDDGEREREKERRRERENRVGEKRNPQLVIPHYVKLNFPSCSSFIWCHNGGRVCVVAEKNRSALFRLVSAIMKKRHQLKNGGSLQRLSQHSADNNYWLLSGDKRKSVEGKRTRDGARSLSGLFHANLYLLQRHRDCRESGMKRIVFLLDRAILLSNPAHKALCWH